jgi:hypothetical protein
MVFGVSDLSEENVFNRISDFGKNFPTGLDMSLLEAEAVTESADSWQLRSFSDDAKNEVL